jgi:hypothetical protein
MKITRLPILGKEDVKEGLAHLGADVSEGLKADQLANLYSEWLEEMPADVDLVGVYVEDNQMTSRRGLVFRTTGSLFFGFASFDWGQGRPIGGCAFSRRPVPE